MCGERSAPLRDGFSATKSWSSSHRSRGRTGLRSARETFVLADTSTCAMRLLCSAPMQHCRRTDRSARCYGTKSLLRANCFESWSRLVAGEVFPVRRTVHCLGACCWDRLSKLLESEDTGKQCLAGGWGWHETRLDSEFCTSATLTDFPLEPHLSEQCCERRGAVGRGQQKLKDWPKVLTPSASRQWSKSSNTLRFANVTFPARR